MKKRFKLEFSITIVLFFKTMFLKKYVKQLIKLK